MASGARPGRRRPALFCLRLSSAPPFRPSLPGNRAQISSEGLIAIVLAQSPEFVAPFGAKKAVFGTNPICISVPSVKGPVTMDMATAAYAWFGVLEAKTAGRQLPHGVAQNAAGEITTDPSEVLSGGAIRVFDGSHKGSNLALMVELLAGPLVGAAVTDKLKEKNWGECARPRAARCPLPAAAAAAAAARGGGSGTFA